MIIKSMSRKEASFAQLIEYLERDSARVVDFELYQNLFARDQASLIDEFEDNAAFLKKRKNGNFMYHEILSVSPSSQLSREQQKDILRQIAEKYMEDRAKYNLVYAVLHDDHEHHLHYHFLISANEMRDQKRTRLSKTKFDSLKKQLERHVLQNFPEMEQAKLIGKPSKLRVSQKEQEMKRRTGLPSKKDLVKITLEDIFRVSANADDFYKAMEDAGFELYQRGKAVGVRGRKSPHRLQTLGVLEAYREVEGRLGLVIGSKAEQQQSDDEPARQKKKQKAVPKKPEDSSRKQPQKQDGVSQERKDELAHILKDIFEHSSSAAEIVTALEAHKVTLMERGDRAFVKDLVTGQYIALADLSVQVKTQKMIRDETLQALYETSKRRIWHQDESQKKTSQKEDRSPKQPVEGQTSQNAPAGMFDKLGKVFRTIIPSAGQQSKAAEDKDGLDKAAGNERQSDMSDEKLSEEVKKRAEEMARFRKDRSGKSRQKGRDDKESE